MSAATGSIREYAGDKILDISIQSNEFLQCLLRKLTMRFLKFMAEEGQDNRSNGEVR